MEVTVARLKSYIAMERTFGAGKKRREKKELLLSEPQLDCGTRCFACNISQSGNEQPGANEAMAAVVL